MARWDKILSRGRVEDRRTWRPLAVGGLSLTSLTLILALQILTGQDLTAVLPDLPPQTGSSPLVFDSRTDDYPVFASAVLGSNNLWWQEKLADSGVLYDEPTLVLFRDQTSSACGLATSAVGPHYCFIDDTIYLDETFFNELTSRFGAAGGDVAETYVIAHEVGHHVQNELNILEEVDRFETENPGEAQAAAVKLELQADCLAGWWSSSLEDQAVLEPGEIGEAMDAVAAVGDDRIQAKVMGYVNPETWTHGSSEERVFWFTKGYNASSLSDCNTFYTI